MVHRECIVRTLAAATSLPWLGSICHATLSGGAVPSLVVGVRGLAALSLPLAPVLPAGPGCQLLVSPDLLELNVMTGAALDVGFAIPTEVALVGQSLRQQAVLLQLTAGGAIAAVQSSNALSLTIGAL